MGDSRSQQTAKICSLHVADADTVCSSDVVQESGHTGLKVENPTCHIAGHGGAVWTQRSADTN